MATRDEPLDPQEVLAAAEQAHLASRHTVPISRDAPAAAARDSAHEGSRDTAHEGSRDSAREGAQNTVRLDRNDTVRLDRGRAGGARADTVRLPGGRPSVAGDAARTRAPLPLAAAVAAGWAALVSLLPVAGFALLLQAAEAGPFALAGPVRVAVAGWLLGHGVPVQTPQGPIGLVPLALSVLAAWRMVRAGVHTTRAVGARGSRSPRRALIVAAAVAAAYGVIGALVAAFAGGPGWGPAVLRAGLTLAGFGFVAAGFGALRAVGVMAAWRGRVPPVLAGGARGGLVAAAGVLAAGAAVAGVALASSGGPAADILAAYRTSVAGQGGLTLLCLAYLPNLAAWAVAYLAGPGFAVGAGTVVRSSEVAIGPLPALPVFAGLPDGPLPTLGAVLLAVPVAAGAVAGWLFVRAVPGWSRLAAGAVIAGGVAGAVLGLAAAGSGGPLGGGQLASFGPAPLPVAGWSALTVTAGALLGGAATVVLARWRRG